MIAYDEKGEINQQAVDDIWTIVGGHFTPDALSPEVYEEIQNRVLSQPEEYLATFENMFLGMEYDPEDQADLFLAKLLELVRDAGKNSLQERLTFVTNWLIHQYDSVLQIYDNVENFQMLSTVVPEEVALFAQRLDDRRIDLKMLLE